jgi:hypothetical protein
MLNIPYGSKVDVVESTTHYPSSKEGTQSIQRTKGWTEITHDIRDEHKLVEGLIDEPIILEEAMLCSETIE